MGYFDKFNTGGGIPFMEGRDKGDMHDILDEKLHIIDFGFINGDNGEYAVIQVAEYDRMFYFANTVITDMLKEVQADGMKEELKNQAIVFEERTSKRGRDYIAFSFDV